MSKHGKLQPEQSVTLSRGSKLFSSMQREIDHLFDDVRKGFDELSTLPLHPAVDIVEADGELKITVELPGLKPEEVEAIVEGDTLLVRGEKSTSKEDVGKTWRLSERSYGAFSRSIPLPKGVDPAAMQASLRDGVLQITMPRPAGDDRKRIEIKAG